ncbi:hypothetical protein [Ruminiclostridium josui]|uniref:hypothetical protein n=1 Tax=Ruminiclostridium josui TaxID=1499 RepID=UPI0004664516|nr:hypothetical protein [Ruminiclostridium josui]
MQPKRIIFIDKKGCTNNEYKLNSLPFKEEIIIKKSIELFNDREPCIIHRTYVMKKLMLEINEYFNEVLPDGKGQIELEEIPKNIRALLNINNDVVKVQLDS